MITRPGPLAGGIALGLLALAAAAPLSARAQSADLVLCDRIAADPTDPDKPADVAGVGTLAASDVSTAIKFCAVAAPKSRRAMYQLGRAYAANRQMSEAIAAYRKAAERGSTAAMVELGVRLATGTGVAKDDAQAKKLFEKAAAGGNPRGVSNLTALAKSTGAPTDPAAARALLTTAAEANSAEAQFQLGIMAAQGDGAAKDDVAARSYFEKAAAQGHAEAMVWAGSFASNGRGGPKDADAAKAYYEKAAALGNEDAKAALKRLQCPNALKDKQGKVISELCF